MNELYDPITDEVYAVSKAGPLGTSLKAMATDYRAGRAAKTVARDGSSVSRRLGAFVGRNPVESTVAGSAGATALLQTGRRRSTNGQVTKGMGKDWVTLMRSTRHPIKAQKAAGLYHGAHQVAGMGIGHLAGRAAANSKSLSPATRAKAAHLQQLGVPRNVGGMLGQLKSMKGSAARIRSAGVAKSDGPVNRQVPKPILRGDGGYIHLVSTGTLRSPYGVVRPATKPVVLRVRPRTTAGATALEIYRKK